MNSTAECAMFPDDPWRCPVIDGLIIGITSFSLCGIIFIIGFIVLTQGYKTFNKRLILYLAITSGLAMPFYLMTPVKENDVSSACIAQAFGVTFTQWSTLFWIYAITIELLVNLTKETSTAKHEIVYHIFGWLVPFLIALYPLAGNTYGPAGAWCWIIYDWRWQLGIWYIPCLILIFIMFVIYGYILVNVWKKVYSVPVGGVDLESERWKQHWKKNMKPMMLYPCIYLIVLIGPATDRISTAVRHSDQPYYATTVMQALSRPLKGFAFAIALLLNKDTLTALNPSNLKASWRVHPLRRVFEVLEEDTAEIDTNSSYSVRESADEDSGFSSIV